MKTIRTSFALSAVTAGMFALLVLAPLAQARNTVSVAATACTMEAMQCPDGSWVGRSGPNCEFKCPATSAPAVIPANSETFVVSPRSGDTPLTVRFSSALGDPTRYTIDFGDGATSTYSVCGASFPAQCSTSHTYTAPGTYYATLTRDTCPPGALCFAASPVVGKATIVVGKHVTPPTTGGDNGHPQGSGDVHASSTTQWPHGWFSWFSNFHFKFWPFWR